GTVPTSLTVGKTFQYTATVSGSTNTAVTWTAGGVACVTAAAPGAITCAGLYTAPATIASPTASVTVVAIAQADTTKFASASVTINIGVSLNVTSSTVTVTGTQQFTA